MIVLNYYVDEILIPDKDFLLIRLPPKLLSPFWQKMKIKCKKVFNVHVVRYLKWGIFLEHAGIGWEKYRIHRKKSRE